MRTHLTPHLLLLTAALVASVAMVPAAQAQTPKKPNILVIWGDDIGTENISYYNRGMMRYKTPNIDRLAKEGIFLLITTASKVAPLDARPSSTDPAQCVPV